MYVLYILYLLHVAEMVVALPNTYASALNYGCIDVGIDLSPQGQARAGSHVQYRLCLLACFSQATYFPVVK